jgi:hypothetical protein
LLERFQSEAILGEHFLEPFQTLIFRVLDVEPRKGQDNVMNGVLADVISSQDLHSRQLRRLVAAARL